jgi:hypothetical protein
MAKNEYYDTHDLALAAALLSIGHRPVKLDAANPRRINFVFEASSALSDCVGLYWAQGLLVEPKEYFNALRDLKSWIYAERNDAD